MVPEPEGSSPCSQEPATWNVTGLQFIGTGLQSNHTGYYKKATTRNNLLHENMLHGRWELNNTWDTCGLESHVLYYWKTEKHHACSDFA
jgi:hypothetical protein